MSDQPQNQWNIATEPSDMMKINPILVGIISKQVK